MPAHDQTSQRPPPLRLPGWVRAALFGRNPKVTLVRALILAILCVLGYKATLLHIRVEGISMMPTYQDGSRHFVNRLAYLWHGPQRGDVVGIRLSDPSIMRPSIMYLKRVIGLPGETVAFVNGKVLINDKVLDEPYEKYDCDWNLPPVKLGPDQYFVVGDNRSMPPQFHDFGRAERDHIVGKAIL
jgi:signal peptidase I